MLNRMSSTLAELETVIEDAASHEVFRRLNETLLQFRQLAQDYSEGSDTNREIQRALRSLEQTMREFEPVLRNLRRKPNSLVFGGPDDDDPEPKAAPQWQHSDD